MDRPAGIDALGEAAVLALRALLPATGGGVYLNTGTAGPLPSPVVEAMADEVARQGVERRSGPDHLDRYLALATADRGALGSVLGVTPEEISLTHSTTEGMSHVTLGINWSPGDEAITTDLEHPGSLFPLFVARDRFGATIRTVGIRNRSDDEIIDAFARAISTRTKLVSVSHVSFQNGQLLPISRIAALTRDHGALLLVDGAQSFGAIELGLADLGADAYAVPGQKWLCGPEGTGALWCRPEVLRDLSVTFASYGSAERYDASSFTAHADGRRFQFGTTNPVGYVGQLAAVEFLRDRAGLARATARARALTARAIGELAAIDGVEVLTPADRHATLVSFTIDGLDAALAVDRLADVGIHCRAVRDLGALRLSVAYFITDDELDRAIAAVARREVDVSISADVRR